MKDIPVPTFTKEDAALILAADAKVDQRAQLTDDEVSGVIGIAEKFGVLVDAPNRARVTKIDRETWTMVPDHEVNAALDKAHDLLFSSEVEQPVGPKLNYEELTRVVGDPTPGWSHYYETIPSSEVEQTEQPFAAHHIIREKVAHIEAIDRQVDSVVPRQVIDVQIETSRIKNPDRV